MRSSIGYLDTESWLDFTIGNGITWLVDMFVGMFIGAFVRAFVGTSEELGISSNSALYLL